MPDQMDEVTLPDGGKRVAYDVGEFLTIRSLERAWKFRNERHAAEVDVWWNGKARMRLYGAMDIRVLP